MWQEHQQGSQRKRDWNEVDEENYRELIQAATYNHNGVSSSPICRRLQSFAERVVSNIILQTSLIMWRVGL